LNPSSPARRPPGGAHPAERTTNLAGVPALRLQGVRSGYGEAIVVNGVDLDVHCGEIVALLGKNGMGKSTLLKTVMGFLPIRGGEVALFGERVDALSPHRIARRAIAYTPQEQALFQDLTVRENLRLGLRDDRELEQGIARVGEMFPFIPQRLRQHAGTLSGGEQKMLLVARALISRPKLMLIDEITEGLQPSVIDRLIGALRAERERAGTAMLLVEQHVKFALAVADRYAVLKLGEIAESGAVGTAGIEHRIADQLSV
jgi:ABC-type branched-subunit amino acid transport system ATPase component